MKKNNKKVIIWVTEIMDLIENKPIGGIAVQMYFWSQILANNGWQVYSFARNIKGDIKKCNVVFKPLRNIRFINLFLEWWHALQYIICIRPEVIVFRGAHRMLMPLSIFARLFSTKLVFFSASDVNFQPGKELVGSWLNRKQYQCSIRYINYFVTQNQFQHDTLRTNYGKESIMLFNIWGEVPLLNKSEYKTLDTVWIANFRRLKRAEWVVNAAEELPEYAFAMAGRDCGDGDYYETMKSKADTVSNIRFYGGISFASANELVSSAKLLLCTSTFEGFPNTFLQAWSNGIPVISSVDPSGIIESNNLGVVVSSYKELITAIERLLGDAEYYQTLCSSVTSFFQENHAPQSGYDKLMKYLNYE